MSATQSNKKVDNPGRRGFLCGGALLGTGLLPALSLQRQDAYGQDDQSAILNSRRPDAPYELVDATSQINTACLQCNTGCGIRCKVHDGVVTKIDGNPYSPWTLLPHLPYSTGPDDASPVDGAICPKGQAGLQTAYDPYRLRKVLKRAGRRGENKWISIPFEQAIKEICEGGKLFANVPGEENRIVEGLDALTPLRDPDLAKKMASDVQAILDEKDQEQKRKMVDEFKDRHRDHLGVLIDPDHPDMGPKNNQVVVAWGRIKDGRKHFYKRFAHGLGTTNAHGHTTVCQGSLYFTCKAISEQYVGGKFTGGKKFYWQCDTENSRFVLFVGANLFEANYGPPNRTVRLTNNLVNCKTKIAVVDPRFSKLASKAWKWLPLKPGSDAALAMAIMQWMLDNDRFDKKFLAAANKAAARSNGELSWTNATMLVQINDGEPTKLIRASDVVVDGQPLAQPENRRAKDGKEYVEKFLVCMVNGRPVAVDPNDDSNPINGDLFVDATIGDGIQVKSGLQLLREETQKHSFEQWCAIADVNPEDVVAVARELTSHGKMAAVDLHRGPAQHTNGFYNVLAWMTVNMLLGNFDHKGGMIKATKWDLEGKGGLFDLNAESGVIEPFGISSIRHGVKYEQTTLFEGYPARRNWFPLSSDIYEEIIPSIGDQYPYPIKALILYMGTPVYALPAGHLNIETLCDTEKLPLFIANDILVGTTSMYADYIFPDLTYLERWEFHGSHPNMPVKSQPIRQPVIAPIPETCTVFGNEMPMSFEAMLMGIAEQLQLPNFGMDAFGPGADLSHPDDLNLRAVANIAFGEEKDGANAVPDANDREIEIFIQARRHLPKCVFDPERWKNIVGEKMWPKVVYVLNRGGRFEDHGDSYREDMVAHPYAALLNLYQEKTASTIHAGTGQHNKGFATYLPVADFHGHEPDNLRIGHELSLITNRTIVHTKSRTIANPWLTPLMPENGIQINPLDAKRLGLKNGQRVKVISATNTEGVWPLADDYRKPMIGKVMYTQTVRPGVISFSLGFGHWATGAKDVEIDGHVVKGEPRRAAGIHANAAMWSDPALKNTCMFDPVGGSVSFYDTQVSLVPAEEKDLTI